MSGRFTPALDRGVVQIVAVARFAHKEKSLTLSPRGESGAAQSSQYDEFPRAE